jgi:hypothetical protein
MPVNQFSTDNPQSDALQILTEQFDPEEFDKQDPEEDYYPDEELPPSFTVCATCTCGWYDWNPSVIASSLGEALQSQLQTLESTHKKTIHCEVTFEGFENK